MDVYKRKFTDRKRDVIPCNINPWSKPIMIFDLTLKEHIRKYLLLNEVRFYCQMNLPFTRCFQIICRIPYIWSSIFMVFFDC